MDWLNRWLTLLANVGVVVGLVFVVFEIRQNTDIARMQAYRDNTRELSEWRTQLLSDPSLVVLFNDYWTQGRYHDLSRTDRVRIGMTINNLFSTYENAYLALKFGILQEKEWLRFLPAACMHLGHVERNDFDLPFVTSEFKTHIYKTCAGLPEHLHIDEGAMPAASSEGGSSSSGH